MNYKNGQGNVPKMPDAVVDCIIRTTGLHAATNEAHEKLRRLVHEAAEELLSRLPTMLVVDQNALLDRAIARIKERAASDEIFVSTVVEELEDMKDGN